MAGIFVNDLEIVSMQSESVRDECAPGQESEGSVSSLDGGTKMHLCPSREIRLFGNEHDFSVA